MVFAGGDRHATQRELQLAMKPTSKSKAASPASAPALPPPRARILLVDDHPITRQGIHILLSQQPGIEICGEADNAPRAVELVGVLQPDLVIIDLSLRNIGGLELAKNIKARAPDVRMLVVSMHDEKIYAERAMRAGAMGYLMKEAASEKIVEAVQCVLRGDVYVSAAIKDQMLKRFVNRQGETAQFSIDTLSDREMEVFELIGNGFNTRQIAQRLNLSSKTVDSYREHLKKKLNLASGTDLVKHAIETVRNRT